MKLSKVQKTAMLMAVAVAMMGQVAQAATNTRGGTTSTQKSQSAQGTAAQSAQQAGQAQDGSAQGASRRARGSFQPAGQVQVQQTSKKSARSSAPSNSTEAAALKGSGMNLDSATTARVEKEMQTKPTDAQIKGLEAQAAMDPNGPAAKQLEAIKDDADFDTLVTSAVSKSGSWSAEVKGNLEFVLKQTEAYLNGSQRIIGADGNPIANPSRGQALRQAAKDLEAHTASKGADKKVVLNIRDISKWCK